MKVLICFALCLAAVSAECPQPSVVTPLSVSNFSGVWYQYASYGAVDTQGAGDCSKAEYTLANDTGIVTVNNTASSESGYVEIDGTVELVDPVTQAGVLRVTLQTPVGDKTTTLSVLCTDYDNYAILYNCKSGWLWDTDASWIVTRARVPDSTVIDTILNKIGDMRSAGMEVSIVDYDETYQGDDYASWIVTRARVPDSTVIDTILNKIGDMRAAGMEVSIVDYDETYQGDDCEN